MPTAVDVQSTNVSGGTVGHLDLGDTLTLTYSETIDPYSILAGWTGAATGVEVTLTDGGGSNDTLQVWTASGSAQVPLGTVTLGSTNYVKTGLGHVGGVRGDRRLDAVDDDPQRGEHHAHARVDHQRHPIHEHDGGRDDLDALRHRD